MIDTLTFGRTGHKSTRTLFGAVALAHVDQETANRTLDLLQHYGVNHIDVAASYGDAEVKLGPWMERHRDQFFLATKTEERTYQGAWDELRRSLERLQTNHVDLWQMHVLVDPDEWETAMGPGGALEAFIEAREQGLTRYLGVTGHGITVARMHRRSLERFDFDTVLLPYNYVLMQNRQYAAEFEALLAICRERNVAVQTMKTIARGPWGDTPQTRDTWYAPLDTQAAIDTAVFWALLRPGIFLNTAGDVELLPKILDAADRFEETAVSRPELEAQLAQMDLQPLFV